MTACRSMDGRGKGPIRNYWHDNRGSHKRGVVFAQEQQHNVLQRFFFKADSTAHGNVGKAIGLLKYLVIMYSFDMYHR